MSTATKILDQLKAGKYAPIYFLCGEETYFIDAISDYIEEHVLTEAEKGFNLSILYGKETTIQEVVENAKRFPMMSEHQVVILKEAQHLSRQLEQLEQYISNPVKSTILVICYKYKKPDGRSKITKLLKKQAVYLESKPLYENQVPAFISEQLTRKGYSIHPDATRLLVEYLGTDLGKINNELSKLTLVTTQGKQITPASIEEHIGISKDYNNFELRKAVGERNIIKVQQIINYFSNSPKEHPLVLTTAQLYSMFTQLLKVHASADQSPQGIAKTVGINPYFVKELLAAARNYPMKYCSRAIQLIRDLDVKSKGVGSLAQPHSDLLRETLVKIMAR